MAYEFNNTGNYGGLSGMWGNYDGVLDRVINTVTRVARARRPSARPPARRPAPRPAAPKRPAAKRPPAKRPPAKRPPAPKSAPAPKRPPAKRPPAPKRPPRPPRDDDDAPRPKLPPKVKPLPEVKPKAPVEPKIIPGVPPLSDEMAKLKEDVIARTTQEFDPTQQQGQIQYILDPATGQYIPAIPGMLPPGMPVQTAAAPSPAAAGAAAPAVTPTGIMIPRGVVMRAPMPGGMPRPMPRGPLPKPVITPQQARLGTLTAALAAGLMFL